MNGFRACTEYPYPACDGPEPWKSNVVQPVLNAITVCVDYAGELAITLPRNLRHFDRCVVVTAPHDEATIALCRSLGFVDRHGPRSLYVTEKFYAGGAVFNKWAALEEGIDARLGRSGWIVLWDADTLWPDHLPDTMLQKDCLYTPRRRMLHDPSQWRETLNWRALPVNPEPEFAGFTQIFHASCPYLPPAPWHDVCWRHAGGADSFFAFRWPEEKRIRPKFEVLHLGEAGMNWCGRATPGIDGTIHPDAAARLQQLEAFRRGRRGKGMGRFNHEKL